MFSEGKILSEIWIYKTSYLTISFLFLDSQLKSLFQYISCRNVDTVSGIAPIIYIK